MGLKSLFRGSLCLALLTGCGTLQGSASSWVNRQGGIISDPQKQQRVDAIASRLTAGQTRLHINVEILRSDAVCAYALPDGTLFVTRGLMNVADDDVIAAALAHELGHLLGEGDVPAVVSVKGCNQDLGAEGRADAYGLELLRAEHVPPESMVQMLRLVRDSNCLSPRCVRVMNQRIDSLQERISESSQSK
ncbi:MAG TPA: M48 family metalloprotease [Tepidisphaeraceae bacterium]